MIRVDGRRIQVVATNADLTWVQVVDDTIKIGLGGAIAGVFAWIVARHGSRSAIQKLQFERRSKMLADTAKTYEEFYQTFFDFGRYLHGLSAAAKIAKERSGSDWQNHPLFVKTVEEVLALQRELDKTLSNTVAAQSQLMLMGENQCEQAAGQLCQSIVVTVEQYKFSGTQADLSNYPESVQCVKENRAAFYQHMKTAFDRV
ncbi:MAG TPA: hypothetical protein VNZ64_12660 [Candidatus Acidoferrum sp.]|nr:hypothetical protein [Candidatus Acidoferrum sp.]